MLVDEVLLRPMRLEDVPNVYAIDKISQVVCWSEGTFGDCINAGYDAWILEQYDKIVGYILFYVKVGECHILNLCIHPEKQRHGFGARLLQHSIDFAKSQDATVVLLETRVSNHPAIHLYKKFGFTEISIRKDYYDTPEGGREDAVMMACQLQKPHLPAA